MVFSCVVILFFGQSNRGAGKTGVREIFIQKYSQAYAEMLRFDIPVNSAVYS